MILVYMYRVPENEDFFRLNSAVLNDSQSRSPLEFCLCKLEDKGRPTCGLSAVTYNTGYGSQNHVPIGVPNNPIIRRRRKRQINEVNLTDDWRFYPTSYRYLLDII